MIHFAATWVGGSFIIGLAEMVYNPTKGLVWAMFPLEEALTFVIGNVLLILWCRISVLCIQFYGSAKLSILFTVITIHGTSKYN